MKLVMLPLALSLAGGCAADPDVVVGQGVPLAWQAVVDVPWRFEQDVDLLFVVDNTEGMESKQAELAASFQRLKNHLEFAHGGLPNLHIGVVSSDLGVGSTYPLERCTAEGDKALLARSMEQCAGMGLGEPLVPFVRDQQVGGERITNYQGRLEDMVSCMARLGTRGCQIEQPLASMRAALDGSRPENAGFLRPNAALGVVFLTSEDDCSVKSSELFDPDLDDYTPKFRCFKRGVHCDDDVRAAGTFEGCGPHESSDYVASVSGYVDFLHQLKDDPDSLVVAGMIGGSHVVEVEHSFDDSLQVASHRCQGGIEPYPALRLQAFIGELAGQGDVSPLCGDKAFDALTRTARRIRKSLGTDCLDGAIADTSPDQPGRQPECRIWQRFPDGSAQTIPACPVPGHLRESSPVVPCYIIDTGGSACGDFQTQLRLDVWWGKGTDGRERTQPVGTRVQAECLVEDPEAMPEAEASDAMPG